MGKTTSKIAVIAALSAIWPTYASSQQGGAGTPTAGVPTGSGTPAAAAQPVVSAPVAAVPSAAGSPTGGFQIDIGVNSSLKADSNFSLTAGKSKGTSEIFDNKFSFGLSSVTSAYSLKVVGTGVLRFAHIPGRTINGFEDPTISANFVADNSNSRLTLKGRYRNVDRDFLNPFQIEREEQKFGLLVGNGGTLRDLVLGLKYEAGLNAPLGFVLDLNRDDKAYSNVVNPQIFDSKTDTAKATVLMKVSPVTTFTLSAGKKHYTADDLLQTDRTTTDYSLGILQDLNQNLLLDAQIGSTAVQTDTLFGSRRRSGAVGSVTLTQSLVNGSIFGTIASTRNQNGLRTSLSFGRDLQLLNGNLRGSLGLTKGSTGTSKTIASLAYSHQMANGNINVSLDRAASTNSLNQDIIDTRLGIGYGHTINNVSSVSLSLDWGRSEDAGGTGAPTIDLTNLSAAYSRDLTSDWSMTGGVTLRQRTETGLPNAKSTAFFLTLGRNFSFRP